MLERLSRSGEAALAVDPVRRDEVEALLLCWSRKIRHDFGRERETLEGKGKVADELEMDGKRVGLKEFGGTGLFWEGISIIIFMSFFYFEIGRIDSI